MSGVIPPIPTGKIEKVKYLYDLYRASKLSKDIDIFEEIRNLTGGAVSVVSLKRYKKEYDWKREKPVAVKAKKNARPTAKKARAKRTKKGAKIARPLPNASAGIDTPPVSESSGSASRPQPEPDSAAASFAYPPGAEPDDSKKQARRNYTEAEKMRIVDAVATLRGERCSLEEACVKQGISRKTYWKWVTDNPILGEIHQSGITEERLYLASTLEHQLTRAILDKMSRTHVTEIRNFYVYETDFDSNGNTYIKKRLKSTIETIKDYIPDSATLGESARFLNDLKATLQHKPPQNLEDKSIEDLQAQLSEIEHKLNEANSDRAGSE